MKLLHYWIPLFVFAALIFGLSSIPGDNIPPVPIQGDFFPSWIPQWLTSWITSHPDKIAHGILYAVFGWLCLRTLTHGTRIPFPQAAVFAFIISIAYGATDEWHQYFVPKRACDFNDWLADVAGSLFAILVFYRIYSKPWKISGGQSTIPGK